MNIEVDEVLGTSVGELSVEIVERKGLGHPDTICDSVMEATSQALCRAYLEEFGVVLHYNCDKALLAAGRAEHRLGGGRILEPMTLFMGPVDRPRTVYLQLRPAAGVDLEEIVRPARETMARQLRDVPKLCEQLARGRWKVF